MTIQTTLKIKMKDFSKLLYYSLFIMLSLAFISCVANKKEDEANGKPKIEVRNLSVDPVPIEVNTNDDNTNNDDTNDDGTNDDGTNDDDTNTNDDDTNNDETTVILEFPKITEPLILNVCSLQLFSLKLDLPSLPAPAADPATNPSASQPIPQIENIAIEGVSNGDEVLMQSVQLDFQNNKIAYSSVTSELKVILSFHKEAIKVPEGLSADREDSLKKKIT